MLPEDSGIASALLNTAQQIGGALGLAGLTTVAMTTADDLVPDASGTFYRAMATGMPLSSTVPVRRSPRGTRRLTSWPRGSSSRG